MVMMVVMIGSATSTLAATTTTVVVGVSTARTGGQERGSGHDGQNQRLTKHQQSPQLVEHLRRVHPEKLHTPWLLTLPNSAETHRATTLGPPCPKVGLPLFEEATLESVYWLENCVSCIEFSVRGVQNTNRRHVVKPKRGNFGLLRILRILAQTGACLRFTNR
jgi:hypothetical protein